MECLGIFEERCAGRARDSTDSIAETARYLFIGNAGTYGVRKAFRLVRADYDLVGTRIGVDRCQVHEQVEGLPAGEVKVKVALSIHRSARIVFSFVNDHGTLKEFWFGPHVPPNDRKHRLVGHECVHVRIILVKPGVFSRGQCVRYGTDLREMNVRQLADHANAIIAKCVDGAVRREPWK